MSSDERVSPLLAHLERHLGPFVDADSEHPGPMHIDVARFATGPLEGTEVLSTLGLSNVRLPMNDGRAVRQELVMLYRASEGPRNLAAVMHDVAAEAIRDNRAYLRGELLPPRGPLFDGATVTALYVAIPVYFPDSFHGFEEPGSEPIIFAWLVPITDTEAEYVMRAGWDEFEDRLVEHDPDLCDYRRASVV